VSGSGGASKFLFLNLPSGVGERGRVLGCQ